MYLGLKLVLIGKAQTNQGGFNGWGQICGQ